MSFDHYEQLCLGLERLAADFDDVGRRTAPVYHQLLRSPKSLSDLAWKAFIGANQTTDTSGEWEMWQVHPSKLSCSRFFGRGSQMALDEFHRLAATGSEILADLRSLKAEGRVPEEATVGIDSWKPASGYCGWLSAVQDTVLGCHTTRLHQEAENWRYDMSDVPENEMMEIRESLESRWSDSGSDKSYPLHPLVLSLRHNIMVSSAEAIRIWLDPFSDELVPLDIGIEDSPIYLPQSGEGQVAIDQQEEQGASTSAASSPRWEADTGKLWLGSNLIKHLQQPAQNQRRILAAFETEGWPFQINSPFPDHPGSPKWLGDTITALNKCHKTPGVIRFRQAKLGKGVTWELVVPPDSQRR